jgi:CheY-like chemotaxis protein
MHVECQSCGAKISIPDDKIVPGKEISFTCPRCRAQNSIPAPAAGSGGIGPAAASAPPQSSPDHDLDEAAAAAGEFYEEGVKLALICFAPSSTRERLARIMTDLGYRPVLPESTRDALRRMKVTQFDVILLDEAYDWQAKTQHPILMTLQPMVMATRRHIWLALFGSEFESVDSMRAFQLSVDAVISKKDEAIYDKIIQKSLADHERFYKVYFETARAIGKV